MPSVCLYVSKEDFAWFKAHPEFILGLELRKMLKEFRNRVENADLTGGMMSFEEERIRKEREIFNEKMKDCDTYIDHRLSLIDDPILAAEKAAAIKPWKEKNNWDKSSNEQKWLLFEKYLRGYF